MKYDPEKHHRRSIRLKNYDYSTSGAYFVTICTQNRDCVLGEVMNGKLILNDAGNEIREAIRVLCTFFTGLEIDEYIVMPNHIHAILIISRPLLESGLNGGHDDTMKKPLALFDVVCRFKSWTTKLYLDGIENYGWAPFSGKLWQRNYYEHIIRDGSEIIKLRKYIINNPINWDDDEENPINKVLT